MMSDRRSFTLRNIRYALKAVNMQECKALILYYSSSLLNNRDDWFYQA